jgi:prevent-host-death family protein
MEYWQLQNAKNKFSEVVEKALNVGPQVVTRRGVETVIVMSVAEYRKLTRPKTSLVEFFKHSPFHGLDIDLERRKDKGRDIEL